MILAHRRLKQRCSSKPAWATQVSERQRRKQTVYRGTRVHSALENAGLSEGLSDHWAEGKGMRSCQVCLYICHTGSTISECLGKRF